VRRIFEDAFREDVKPTIAMETFDGEKVRLDPVKDRLQLPAETVAVLPPSGLELEFWEFGGRERNRKLPRGRQPDAILLCYNVADRGSFHAVKHMLMHYRMEMHLNEGHTVVSKPALAPRLAGVVCGCMADLASTVAGEEGVSLEEARDFAGSCDLGASVVSSASTGEGVRMVLYALANALMEAEEDAQAQRMLSDHAPRPEEMWALSPDAWSIHDGAGASGTMTDPPGLRPHEPQRGLCPHPDLVEVFSAQGMRPYGTRPLSSCLELGLLHRAVHVWLSDTKTGGLLLRKYSRSCAKNAGQWGPSGHTEVRCYDPSSGASVALGGPPASEAAEKAAARALVEQLGFKRAPRMQDHWFSSSSRDGNCLELIDVFVVPIDDECSLPPFSMRGDERTQWVHYLDVFGEHGAAARTLCHFEAAYRADMIKRLQARIVHSATATSVVNVPGRPQIPALVR
jgi:hypothetical protein